MSHETVKVRLTKNSDRRPATDLRAQRTTTWTTSLMHASAGRVRALVQLSPLVTAEPALAHDGCGCLAVRAVLALAHLAHRGDALSRLRARRLAHVGAAPALVLWAEAAMAVRVAW